MPLYIGPADFDIVPWNSSFETGIGIIDEQHQRLVELVNDLARQHVAGLEPKRVESVVGALADYAAYHFDTEEALWAEVLGGDKWLDDHHRTHHAFAVKIGSLWCELVRGEATPELDGLLTFLVGWLAHHILYEDKKFAVAVLAAQRGVDVQDAKQQAEEAMSGKTSGLIQSVLSMYKELSGRTLQLEREAYARKRAEQALREQDDHWRTVLGAGHDLVWEWGQQEGAAFDPSSPEKWADQLAFPGERDARIHPDDLLRVREALEEHIAGRSEVFDCQHRMVDDQGVERWVHSRGRLIARTADGQPLRMVGTQTDITERKVAEFALRRERDTRQMISEFAADFMASSLDDFDAAINRALQRGGEYMQADRTYIFLLSDDGERMSNTHEWCAPGIVPQIGQLQNLPVRDAHWWFERLRDPGYVLVPRVAAMQPEAGAEQAILQSQEIQSACAYPLRMGGHLIGFLGNDAVAGERQWGSDELQFLSLMADLLGIALEHRQLQLNRATTMHQLERAERQAHLGHWCLDFVSGTVNWSAEMFCIFELMPEQGGLSYQAYLEKVHPEDRQAVALAYEQAKAKLEPLHLEHRIVLEGGRLKHVDCRGLFKAGPDGQAVGLEGTLQDVSERARHEEDLHRMAYEDSLTRLPNLRAFHEVLEREMQCCLDEEERLALAFVDLDNFREANEQHGPAFGDRLLLALTRRMRLLFDQPGAVARVGGDEFAVLLSHLAPDEDYAVQVKRLLEVLSEPVTIDGVSLVITASVGITDFPQIFPVTGDQLLRQAQQALHSAKLQGKNRFYLYDTMEERNARVLSEELDAIRHALRTNEFVLHYQPKVDMRTGTVVGAEALIRWRKPSGQLLSPAEFLPVVQNHPLELELDDWVIRTAMAQMQTWQRQGLHLQVSVNVSGRQLVGDVFPDSLREILAGFPEVAPASLQLEILESSALQDIVQVSRGMERCRKLGVSFALDDFGTGFSSLAYLKHLPASVLKVDQGFVREMLGNPDDLSIISGVVGMAKAFGMQVIAEGVETLEHGDLLLRLGCDQAQGYGIARPMPPAELSAWVMRWTTPASWREQMRVAAHDLPLLHAEVEHRRWVLALEQWLDGESACEPVKDYHQSRLGQWLDGHDRHRFSHRPEFQRLQKLLRIVHQLGHDIVATRNGGDAGAALAEFAHLKARNDELLETLRSLMQSGGSGGRGAEYSLGTD